LKTHIQHTLPLEFKRCINGINQVLKQAWQISQSSDVKKKERLTTLSLASNCYKFIMELATNGVVITDTIKYVQGKMDYLNKEEKKILQDINKREEAADVNEGLDTEQQTHNTVF
jgi:hypothetical protein